VTTLTDAHLACMYPLGSSLRQVRLAGCIMLTPEALALFIKKAGRNLLELDLAGCQITDIVLEAIAVTCNRLQNLSLGYCNGASQHAMALFFRSIKKVKILKLPWVHMMGKAMVLLLARHLGDQLVELDLAGCVDIGVEEMMYLASHCKQLKKINLKFCTTLNIKGPELLEKHLPEMLPECEITRDKKRYDETEEAD